MVNELKRQIEGLDVKARKLEAWLQNNIDHPDWYRTVTDYNNVLFQLAVKRDQLYNIDKERSYYKTTNLSSRINGLLILNGE